MEEELHLLRQQALRTLPSPKKRAVSPGLIPHRQTSYQLESDFRIDELMFREKIPQLQRREQLSTRELPCDKISNQPEYRHGSSLKWCKRPHQTRPLIHAKRRKRSTSDSSSHSAYSSSSQSHSSSQSSYSSCSSSPSHSHRSRSSSYSPHSRSLSSRRSSSYSRSSFSSSSSRSPPAGSKSKSRITRHQDSKIHGVLDKRTLSSTKKLQSPPLMPSKGWRAELKKREEVVHRHRLLPRSNKSVEHSYRPNNRYSRSPPRLGDKFLEHNRHSSHYGNEFPHHRHRPRSSSRERRVIHQLRRSPAVENSCYSRGRMRPSYSPPRLRHRTKYSPTRVLRRRRMHSLDRSRRPIERSSRGRGGRGERGERSNRLPSIEHERKLGTVVLDHRDRHHTPKSAGVLNTNGATKLGRSASDADRDKDKREKRERKESTGGTENDTCINKELESVRKEDLSRKDLETQFEASDLLGDYEFNVELDYDENMEELDIHPIESPKAEDGHNKVSVSGTVTETVQQKPFQDTSNQSDNTESRSLCPESLKHHCPSSEENGREETINSPIRVSPQRDKSRRSKEDSHKTSFDRKLSVKERLYVSRQTIEEKRRAATKSESQSLLRPSLASRLGPSPHSRHRSDDYHKSQQSRMLSKSSKGDALAIAEAYRRKRRREASGLHEDEVQKAKKFTEIINEQGSKNKSKKSHVLADVENDGDREKALDKRINEIKEQNKAILKRNREIEEDREMYG